jgi:hypothetical protein
LKAENEAKLKAYNESEQATLARITEENARSEEKQRNTL